ncbi:MAG: laminin B domain-containing protein [Saprospiraceae bacterium]
MIKNILLLLLLSSLLRAQTSTFDTNNEDWGASGDPQSSIAAWLPTGGMPGGNIRVTDAATGGTWYFEAPLKFRGNKCDAYGRYLRWDQYTSDTTNSQPYGGRPDVVIEGAGMTLIFDNAQNPQLAWTHYDLLLREDAGWHLNDLTGPTPSQAQFRTVLANVTAFRIRGEYRSQADYGGLDNVVIESNFRFDLDDDNSSLVFDDGFATDTLCIGYSPVADLDVVLFSEKKVDSVVFRLLLTPDAPNESLDIVGPLPSTLSVIRHSPVWLVLKNNGSATLADIVAGIQAVRYANLTVSPTRGERFVTVRIWDECGEMALRYAYLRVFPAGDAGLPADTTLCANAPSVNLFAVLGGMPDPGGYWQPNLPGGVFAPAASTPGIYSYILPAAGNCPGDTATVSVAVEQPPGLQSDTVVCRGEPLDLSVPSGLIDWQWGDGSRSAFLRVMESGRYTLTGHTATCMVSDTVAVSYINCAECQYYIPNVFSPNDDGRNDVWQVFLPCIWQRFRLEVFDRWGNLVFVSADPEQVWNGKAGGMSAPPGVYVWQLEWTGELLGEEKNYLERGGVTLVR